MKARLLITMTCQRSCPGCCNGYSSIMKSMKTVPLEYVADHELIMLSGGEPMLYPGRIKAVIGVLREQNLKRPIFMYTSLYRSGIYEIVSMLDGVHFTLHEGATAHDVGEFYMFQAIANQFPDKSFRAYIDPRVEHLVKIQPEVWHRLEIKPWMSEEECPLPDGEELLLLEDAESFV